VRFIGSAATHMASEGGGDANRRSSVRARNLDSIDTPVSTSMVPSQPQKLLAVADGLRIVRRMEVPQKAVKRKK
jgi:hypothetical protein